MNVTAGIPATSLAPLDEIYADRHLPLPACCWLQGEEMPQPYRELLVHHQDMTSTLQEWWGDEIVLETLDCAVNTDQVTRLVALCLRESKQPVEFGAIVIYTASLPPEAREMVNECRIPLGAILARYSILYQSRPRAFLSVESDELIQRALGLEHRIQLYGRSNRLELAGGEVLADVVEILPPMQEKRVR